MAQKMAEQPKSAGSNANHTTITEIKGLLRDKAHSAVSNVRDFLYDKVYIDILYERSKSAIAGKVVIAVGAVAGASGCLAATLPIVACALTGNNNLPEIIKYGNIMAESGGIAMTMGAAMLVYGMWRETFS